MKKIRLGKRGIGLIALGFGAYLYFMLANIPAAAAYKYFVMPFDKGRRLSLQGLNGTLWQGEAMQARVAGLNFGKLNWDVRLRSLITGKLGLGLHSRGENSRIDGAARAGLNRTLYVDNLQGKIPAAMFMPLFYGFPIAIDGQISADIKRAEIRQGKRLEVEGKMVWHGAALSAPQTVNLGDLFVALLPEPDGTKLLLSDQGGPLTLEGTIQVKHNGQYKANIYLGTRNDKQPALSTGLKMLGRSNPNGKILVSRVGKLPNW